MYFRNLLKWKISRYETCSDGNRTSSIVLFWHHKFIIYSASNSIDNFWLFLSNFWWILAKLQNYTAIKFRRFPWSNLVYDLLEQVGLLAPQFNDPLHMTNVTVKWMNMGVWKNESSYFLRNFRNRFNFWTNQNIDNVRMCDTMRQWPSFLSLQNRT